MPDDGAAQQPVLQAASAAQKKSAHETVEPAQVKQKLIPVVFACDENYAPYLPAVIQSLLDNASADFAYEIIIMDCCAEAHSEIFAEAERDLQEMLAAKCNFSLRTVKMRAALEQNAFLHKNAQAMARYGYGTYARILIPDLLENYEKALYLDIDHIILDDVAKIFDFPLGDALIAAVPDINAAYARLQPHSKRKRLIEEKLALAADNHYAIASPMLFNIKACRSFGFTDKVLALLSRDYALPFPDQDAINAVCKGRVYYLPQKWGRVNGFNFAKLCRIIRKKDTQAHVKTILGDRRAETENPALIHYVTKPKPWAGIGSDFSGLWWRSALKTKKGADLLFSLLFPLTAQGSQSCSAKTYKIFGLPFLTVKTCPPEKYYLLGKLCFARKKCGKENCYIYIFGIKTFTIGQETAQPGQ